jgi:hypothetical protein
MQAPRCPECSELYDHKVPAHSGPAIFHGIIYYWPGRLYADRALMLR